MANLLSMSKDGVLEYGGAVSPAWISNVGLTRTATTLVITGATAAWSTDNPGWITVPSQATPGQYVCLKFTAEVTADFNADFVDSRLGMTTAVNWANDFPYYIYIVNEDDTAANAGFFGSRLPNLSVTPAAGLIHDTDANAADVTQNSIHGFWADDAGKAAKPCRLIGSCRMTMVGATNKFVPTALGNADGINMLQNSVLFTLPVAQNGAEAGKTYTTTDGATALAFTGTEACYYTAPDADGFTTVVHIHDNQSAAGADGTVVRWMLPYAAAATEIYHGSGSGILGGNNTYYFPKTVASASYAVVPYYNSVNSSLNGTLDSDFSNTNDTMYFSLRYKIL